MFLNIEKMDKRKIGKKISELRNEKGISQKELAELTGMKQQNIARIELGQCSTGIDILSKIAAAFDCNIDFVRK
jgi:transcriptional regulator with XRE-family HTH domain